MLLPSNPVHVSGSQTNNRKYRQRELSSGRIGRVPKGFSPALLYLLDLSVDQRREYVGTDPSMRAQMNEMKMQLISYMSGAELETSRDMA